MNMKRIIYFDLLRIIAIVAVIFVHISGQNWYAANVHSYEWNVYNVFDAISRFGVPIFVMISGALFLSKEQSITKIFKKNILKIAVIFFVWSLIYTLYQLFVQQTIATPVDFVLSFLKGPYHFWFLFMIVGLYIVTPLLRKIVVDDKMLKYFLLLALIFAFIIPKSIDLIGLGLPRVADTLSYIVDSTKVNLVLGYSGYFVLGYLLNKIRISKKAEYIIYALGVFGAIFTIIATMLMSGYKNSADTFFYKNLTINVLFEAIAVFVFFKQHLNKRVKRKTEKKILFLSKCTLGIYLVHPLIIFVLNDAFGLNTASFNPILSIPILVVLVASISLTISAILNKIPFIKKWVV